MKKILFTTFSAFAFMFLVNSASAGLFSSLTADPVCSVGCNRETCSIQEVQAFCLGKCKPDSIKNCVGKNPTPKPAAQAAPAAKQAFCAVSGKFSQLKPVSDKVCQAG
jgi:hypothetical protein